jgi:hypothetical protein
MTLYGRAALGAIAVAAVGVYGVLQMALMVAQGTGRSIMADKDGENPSPGPRTDIPKV